MLTIAVVGDDALFGLFVSFFFGYLFVVVVAVERKFIAKNRIVKDHYLFHSNNTVRKNEEKEIANNS
jgi:hypothetical protein